MRLALALTSVLALTACGAASRHETTTAPGTSASRGTTTATTAASPAEIVASEGALNAPPPDRTATATAAASAGEPADDMISVAPGFRPDPIIRRGRGGGPVPAESRDESCRGYVRVEPSYVLKVDAAMARLRILVAMRGDATLVVELADGRILCNDDSEGLNPIVEGAFPQGRHRVWVGTYSASGVGTPYTIAFTAQPTLGTGLIEAMPETR